MRVPTRTKCKYTRYIVRDNTSTYSYSKAVHEILMKSFIVSLHNSFLSCVTAAADDGSTNILFKINTFTK